jgi:hypothetical protein
MYMKVVHVLNNEKHVLGIVYNLFKAVLRYISNYRGKL